MLRHIVLYRLHDRSEEAKQALKNKFLTLQGNVPRIRALEAGTDCLFSGRSYDVALSITCENKEDLAAYKAHPFHAGEAEYVHSVMESAVSCDFEADR